MQQIVGARTPQTAIILPDIDLSAVKELAREQPGSIAPLRRIVARLKMTQAL